MASSAGPSTQCTHDLHCLALASRPYLYRRVGDRRPGDRSAGAAGGRNVDITDPASPAPLGTIEADGDPTSVGVAGRFVYASVNTGDFVDPSGTLLVIDLVAQTIDSELELAGQPDSVAVSPDGTFLAVVVENQRDEDLDDGLIPQPPAGTLHVFRLVEGMIDGDPVDVDLTALAETAAEDPEPEFVDINDENVAIVTLQENNHLAIVDLETATITADFPAGTTTIENVDIADDSLIEYTGSIVDRRREPDAVAWLDTETFVTANEGDYTDADGVEGAHGGSRSSTPRVKWCSSRGAASSSRSPAPVTTQMGVRMPRASSPKASRWR